jgi:hypothetical protein
LLAGRSLCGATNKGSLEVGFPDGEHRAHETLTEAVGSLGYQWSDQLVDGDRNLHGRKEEFLLAVKVMMDERYVDPGVGCNAAH